MRDGDKFGRLCGATEIGRGDGPGCCNIRTRIMEREIFTDAGECYGYRDGGPCRMVRFEWCPICGLVSNVEHGARKSARERVSVQEATRNDI